jgi:hypothetical protein
VVTKALYRSRSPQLSAATINSVCRTRAFKAAKSRSDAHSCAFCGFALLAAKPGEAEMQIIKAATPAITRRHHAFSVRILISSDF